MCGFRHISTSGLAKSDWWTPFSAKIRSKRLAIDAKPIYGRFEDRPTSDFSTSGLAETGSRFQRPNGGRWAHILYWVE